MVSQLLEHNFAGEDVGLAPLTTDQYHQMIATGILGVESKIELLDGRLALKDRRDQGEKPINVGPRHSTIVMQLFRVLQKAVETDRIHVRCQQPATLPPANEPEPDVSIVTGSPMDYLNHHPGPNETVAVMEVADRSLRRDRDTKRRIYANAGIEIYWIFDLSTDQIEVYTQPDTSKGTFGQVQTFGAGGSVDLALPNGNTVQIAVADVLL